MATREDQEDGGACGSNTAAVELSDVERRQARFAAREAQKQERLRAKFAREAAKSNEEWEHENRRFEEKEERRLAEQAARDESIASRTRQQHQQMSRWQRAVASRSAASEGRLFGIENEGGESAVTQLSLLQKSSMKEPGVTKLIARDIDQAQVWSQVFKIARSNYLPPNFAPVSGRKVRILVLHGNPGNTNLIKFASMQLRRVIGDKSVDWLFLDAPNEWQSRENPWRWSELPRSEFEIRIADGQPFKAWYGMDDAGNLVDFEASCDYLEEKIGEMGPIDAIVAFSQGASLVSILIDTLRQRGQAVPWRLNVFFNGGHLIKSKVSFKESSPHPTIMVPGGLKNDPYHNIQVEWGREMYTDLTILAHEDGHVFPSKQPRATEIYMEIASQIWKHTGIRTAVPKAQIDPGVQVADHECEEVD